MATNVIGDGPESSILTATAGEEPGIIDTLSITLQSSTAVTFSWDPSAIDDGGLAITGYVISRDDGDYVFDTSDTAGASDSSYTYTVPSGEEGTTYRFRITAQNVLGTGLTISDEIRLVATDAPGTPTVATIETSRTLTSIILSFGEPATDGGAPIIGYHLYRDQGPAGSPMTLIYNGTAAPEIIQFEVTELITALAYSFELYAVNKIFQSDTPATIEVLIGTLPAPPQLVRRVIIDAVDFVDGELTIEWDYPSHTGGVDLTSYEVWIDDGNGDWSSSVAPLATPGPEDLSLLIDGLTTGVTYGLRMTAITPIGTSVDADVVYIICASKAPAPDPPSVESRTRESVTLAWNEPTSATQATVTGYNLYYNDLSVGDWMLAYSGVGYPTR